MIDYVGLAHHGECMLVDDSATGVASICYHLLNVSKVFSHVTCRHHWNIKYLTELSQSLCIVSHRFGHYYVF